MKIGIIGAGKMAEAIIGALLDTKTTTAHEIFASDISADRRQHLKKQYGINSYSRNSIVAAEADVVFLAIKPQQLDEVLSEIAPHAHKDALIISIAAGKRIGRIESLLPGARVVRVMPNLPCTVAQGMSVFCMGTSATDADRSTTNRLLSCFGRVLELPEDKFDAVTALSGSGPAIFTFLLAAMVEGAVGEGLSIENALLLAKQTMLGTATLLLQRDITPQELITSVTSAKGTTAAGLDVLNSSDVVTILRSTIAAAARRSRELSV